MCIAQEANREQLKPWGRFYLVSDNSSLLLSNVIVVVLVKSVRI